MQNCNQSNKHERLPLLPLRGVLAYPNMVLHLDVGRDKSISALEFAMDGDKQLLVVAQRDALKDNPHLEDMYGVGTIVSIKQIVRRPDNTVSVLVEGKSRAFLLNILEAGDMQMAEVERFDSQPLASTPEYRVYMDRLKEAFKRYASLKRNISPELRKMIEHDDDADTLTDLIAANVIRDIKKKQQVLETRDVLKRMKDLSDMVNWECECIQIDASVNSKVRANIDHHQKEYYLREQLRVISENLGDDDNEIEGYRAKLNALALNEEARTRVEREIDRLSRMNAQSPESAVGRNYIEYMLELPWGKQKHVKIDLKKARNTLERDHYGLESVKKRIIEFLAVRSVSDELNGSILCLVGPPGVGKTSIARSIARAMNREFTRLSLGGLRDEAELRGHRRTYIGAMPGRIISSIKQCGYVDPVFLLDEIDKMTSDMRGDPASAMLEILDPEQNATFRDNYLEAPFDLSKVFFITTANTFEGIPRPLLDRMEIIEVPSYTIEEKTQIAKRHLLPKQLKIHAMKRGDLKMSDKTIRALIDGYTREAGVRNLERELATICRKATVGRLTQDAPGPSAVTEERLNEYLGVKRFTHMKTLTGIEVGVVNGLAWTSVGGEILPIEAGMMPGSGLIEMTGSLGGVMKESARIALSYLRAKGEEFGLTGEFFKTHDLHIHMPEASTPKDGPSAGVAMTCAMISALTNRPARQDVAMTGEITLRGRVLPIGGVKEKLLAAYRMGVMTVLLPSENEKDLEELPKNVRESLRIVFIEDTRQAIDLVLGHKSLNGN